MKKYACAVLAILFLSACAPLKPRPAPDVYVLHAAPQERAGGGSAVISIPEPEVPAGFDTARIALYLDGGRRMEYYAGAAWPERLGKVLQEVLIQSAPSGLAAQAPGGPLRASYDLIVRVRDFEPVYAAGPEDLPRLKVSLNFRLVSLRGRKAVLDETFSATAPAAANTRTAIVSGLEELLRRTVARGFKKAAFLANREPPPDVDKIGPSQMQR